jgi:2-C-methyl-D-erythritol 4-phosphate cytidylyltransferase
MRRVLGLVPALGRHSLVRAPFHGQALFLSAVDALEAVPGARVVVVVDAGLRKPIAADLHSRAGAAEVAVEVAESPREDDRLRELARASDVCVVHDPLCPLVTSRMIAELVADSPPDAVRVSVRPVVDTVKARSGNVVSATLNRDAMRIVSSPIVLPASTMAANPAMLHTLGDPSQLVQWLRQHCDVALVDAPATSRRIEDESALRLVQAVEEARAATP